MTLNLVTTCDLVTIFQRPFFDLLKKSFDLVTLWDLMTVFAETKSVTKSRLHCTSHARMKRITKSAGETLRNASFL